MLFMSPTHSNTSVMIRRFFTILAISSTAAALSCGSEKNEKPSSGQKKPDAAVGEQSKDQPQSPQQSSPSPSGGSPEAPAGGGAASPHNPAAPGATTAKPNNFHQVNTAVYRSARPEKAHFAFIAAQGIKTIVSLEQYTEAGFSAKDEETLAQANGMKFLNVPMSGLLRPKVANIQTAVNYLMDPTLQPVLVHCKLGSDRTGIVVAAYHMKADKWSYKQAVDDMRRKEFGHNPLLYWWDSVLKEIK